MKISLNWLKDWVEMKEDDFDKISKILSDSTSEVEELIHLGKGLDNIVVGQILEINPHPDADKMRVTLTRVGKGKDLQIVCRTRSQVS